MKRRVQVLATAGLMLAVLPLATAHAQGPPPPMPLPDPKVVPIQVTGPPSERLNLIVLGDGYQWDQQSIFRADVDRNLSVMWATEPFRTYRNYMNVYAVELASIDYGTRRDPDGRVRHPDGTIRDTGVHEGAIDAKNTALRLWYSDGLTNPLARGTTYGPAPLNCAAAAPYYPEGVNPCETGNQAHNRIISTHVAPMLGIPANSQNLQTLAIFNTFTYGGIGGTQATTSGGSPQGPLISLHEIGHSLGSLADEYPYSSRDVVRPCRTGGEPGSFHHTIMTSAEEMIAAQHKWWRWLGEESLSGGTIGLHEGGNSFPCGVRRPSEHSMMRWIGFDFDQVGLEHMVARVTGMRNAGQMNVENTPTADAVPRDSVLWVETGHPRFHEVNVTWRTGGPDGPVIATNNSRNLDLEPLNLAPGTVVHAEIRDPVGPDGIDWVRNPSTGNSSTNSGFNGPRFVQTREWTVGDTTVTPSPAAADITAHTANTRPVAGDEVVYVETNHPNDRVLPVTWSINGVEIANPRNSRNLDLGALNLMAGTHTLKATVTDGTTSDSVEWKIDNVDPTAPRRTSAPLTRVVGNPAQPIYFNGWDMWVDMADDRTGYEGQPAVVGQIRLNGDGWFNYFGFPEQPMPESPFQFRHSGTDVKALTYGNLGTGGLSRATFEQTLPDDHPSGGFIPGFGTHLVEHRAIDPAGNYSTPESYRATVLPGGSPDCTTTITGTANNVNVTTGVTCLQGAQVNNVTVGAGASLVAKDSTIGGTLNANGAEAVQVIGSTVNGVAQVRNSTRDVTIAGSTFRSSLALTGNTQVTANERFSRLAGAYGPILAGSSVNGLTCADNSADVKDFGAPNKIQGSYSGCALAPVDVEAPVGGNVPATLSLSLGPAAQFGAIAPGVGQTYTASTSANVISTAGDALLSVADPSPQHTGHLVNGSFFLPQPLQARARNAANQNTAYNNVGSSASPLNLLTWNAPISNDALSLEFSQRVNANDALRTGTYSKTLTFTLSTTQP
jgi:hypothetical protein